jgi:hypothetical protein
MKRSSPVRCARSNAVAERLCSRPTYGIGSKDSPQSKLKAATEEKTSRRDDLRLTCGATAEFAFPQRERPSLRSLWQDYRAQTGQ